MSVSEIPRFVAIDFALRRPKSFTSDPFFPAAAIAGFLVMLLAALGNTYLELKEPCRNWLACVSFVVIQPLIEELIFRGFLQTRLLRNRQLRLSALGISGANIVTSLAFTLIHLAHHAPLWAAAVFAPSILLGMQRERSGSVWPAFMLHAVFNVQFLAAAWLAV